jgi:hypothetical protein
MYKGGGVLAQFDDRTIPGGLAYGWHQFERADFTVAGSPFEAPTKG